MKKKVTVIDDTLRRNACRAVPMVEFIKAGGRPPPGKTPSHVLVPLINTKTRKRIQTTVKVERVYEGQHLVNAVHRAKRYIRSGRVRTERAPGHIHMALAAFQQADKHAFEKAMRDAMA